MATSSLRSVSISRTCGIFSRITGSSVSRAAAMAGRAAFLAPLIRTVPNRGLPPRITNLSIQPPYESNVHCTEKSCREIRTEVHGRRKKHLDYFQWRFVEEKFSGKSIPPD